jgi:hypothetical protein
VLEFQENTKILKVGGTEFTISIEDGERIK